MRHKIAGRKFNRTSGERKALFLNLAKSLLTHEQIKTTLPKAKDLRPIVERLVTKARDTSLHTRRQLIAQLRDPALVDKLMSSVAPRFTNRAGGYTRILKAGFRYGDNAPMAIIEFVDFDPSAPKAEVKAASAEA